MAKKDNKKLIIIIAILAIIGIGLWYFAVPKVCKVDTDCPTGQVCSMDQKCIAFNPVPERQKDNLCPDNAYPTGAYDPDCPMYCPTEAETGRAGGARVCCYTDDGLVSVNCDTRKPLNLNTNVIFSKPEQKPGSDLYTMAVIKWGTAAETAFLGTVRQLVDITTGAAPGSATSYDVVLDVTPTVKTDPAGVAEPIFTAAWTACEISAGVKCVGPAGKRTVLASSSYPSAWVTPAVTADSIAYDTYKATFSYCGDEIPAITGIPQSCPADLVYSMIVKSSVLSFSISVGIGA